MAEVPRGQEAEVSQESLPVDGKVLSNITKYAEFAVDGGKPTDQQIARRLHAGVSEDDAGKAVESLKSDDNYGELIVLGLKDKLENNDFDAAEEPYLARAASFMTRIQECINADKYTQKKLGNRDSYVLNMAIVLAVKELAESGEAQKQAEAEDEAEAEGLTDARRHELRAQEKESRLTELRDQARFLREFETEDSETSAKIQDELDGLYREEAEIQGDLLPIRIDQFAAEFNEMKDIGFVAERDEVDAALLNKTFEQKFQKPLEKQAAYRELMGLMQQMRVMELTNKFWDRPEGDGELDGILSPIQEDMNRVNAALVTADFDTATVALTHAQMALDKHTTGFMPEEKKREALTRHGGDVDQAYRYLTTDGEKRVAEEQRAEAERQQKIAEDVEGMI